jgi:hypothetical protein
VVATHRPDPPNRWSCTGVLSNDGLLIAPHTLSTVVQGGSTGPVVTEGGSRPVVIIFS